MTNYGLLSLNYANRLSPIGSLFCLGRGLVCTGGNFFKSRFSDYLRANRLLMNHVNEIRWNHWPRSEMVKNNLLEVVKVFESVHDEITSANHSLKSNEVLELARPGLEKLGFEVETGKRKSQKIRVPVLFGLNGQPEKTFEADAFNSNSGIVIEVEAGRAVVNNQFLKDLFQAIVMHGVDYLVIALRNKYTGDDFLTSSAFLDALYSSNRFHVPLKGVLILGY